MDSDRESLQELFSIKLKGMNMEIHNIYVSAWLSLLQLSREGPVKGPHIIPKKGKQKTMLSEKSRILLTIRAGPKCMITIHQGIS